MLIHENSVIKHFKQFPRFEPISIDSSALMEFKFCPYAYFLRYVLGYTEAEKPPYFAWGSAYHKYRETLELVYKANNNDNSKLDLYSTEALTAALKTWGATKNPLPGSKFAQVTKERLIHAILESHRHWKKEKITGSIIVLQTEQPFNIELPNGVTRSGRFDQVISWNGRIWGRDFKTTTMEWKYLQRTFWPNDQFSGYTYAQSALTGKATAGQLVEAVINRPPTKAEERLPTIESKIVTINEDQLKTWVDEQKFWDDQLRYSRENDLYSKNEKNCYRCKYHQICEMPSEMGKEMVLKSKYRHEVWDNTYEAEG